MSSVSKSIIVVSEMFQTIYIDLNRVETFTMTPVDDMSVLKCNHISFILQNSGKEMSFNERDHSET